MGKTKKLNAGLQRAIDAVNGQHKLAELLGVSQPTIHHYLYENCPPERAVEIERVTGVPREEIRPDIFSRGDVSNG